MFYVLHDVCLCSRKKVMNVGVAENFRELQLGQSRSVHACALTAIRKLMSVSSLVFEEIWRCHLTRVSSPFLFVMKSMLCCFLPDGVSLPCEHPNSIHQSRE